jgi:glycosyltransferase involved in cell wall biosynthesis
VKTATLNEPYSIGFDGYFHDEPFVISRLKVKMRPILYRLTASLIKGISRGKQPCIFTLSLIAREQFIRAGFDERTLFPFGYFVARKNNVGMPKKEEKSDLKLVFVGALIKRKGVDIAVQAVETLYKKGYQISFDLYGSGDPSIFCSPSSACVHYKGVIPLGEAQSVIAQYDLLMLPSRHDGWGLVVNEALLQGVPVIVSDHVGAKCLVETSGSGLIFRNNDLDDLAIKIESVLLNSNKLKILKQNALEMAPQISPEVAAQYLVDVFKDYFFENNLGVKPNAIWCGMNNSK